MDAVRPDRLSCYGYDKIETKGIDDVAEEGVIFKNCISSSSLTPVATASILSGKNPDKTGVRDPFNVVKTRMISDILKEQGYVTAGFIGIDLIDSKHKFNNGFDHFDETTEEDSFHTMFFKNGKQKLKATLGSWWVDRMFDWLKAHAEDSFFIWGHYFHVHFLAEKDLLFSGKLDPNQLYDFAYYDAKVKYMDEQLFLPLNATLKELGIWDDTTIVVTSDHGETLGTKQPTWKTFFFNYPQHKTMYEPDLKVPLIIKNRNLKQNKINHTVRSIDIVPTIVDLLNLPTDEKFDGLSLLPLIRDEEFPELITYSEELFKNRGAGSLQAVRTPRYKLIRNVTKNFEEFYNISKDPIEKTNIINTANPDEKILINQFREIMNKMYISYKSKVSLTKEDKTDREKIGIKKALRKIKTK
jgi:arylsulfatase A-like enzyme